MRKIETINFLKGLNLPVAEAREFKFSDLPEMVSYASGLIKRFGFFNLRTDFGVDNRLNFNLPFIRHCSISLLREMVREYGHRITYIIHQDIPVENQVFNGVLRVCDGFVIGEINDVDRTSLREAMKVVGNVKRVCDNGSIPVFASIKRDLEMVGVDAWFELSAYKDGRIVYWQLRDEKINDHIKKQFII